MTDFLIKKICNHYIVSNDKLNVYLYIYSNNGLFKEYLN